MAKFRFHRSLLAESLKTEVTVETMNELQEIVESVFPDIPIASLVTEFYGYDHRLKADAYSVRVFGIGVLGFLDEELIWKE